MISNLPRGLTIGTPPFSPCFEGVDFCLGIISVRDLYNSLFLDIKKLFSGLGLSFWSFGPSFLFFVFGQGFTVDLNWTRRWLDRDHFEGSIV